ncbi:AsmA family protein [Paenalcaligenes niemegkensis]|uniref:AsmA family protein n=1 Tax=Paenalcaligenes niemegkensis TaxID=2895469 RepID=UPI001EE94BAD|nr:AsmA family protein [Paenalcaligenes niemegkensis]MCQ9615349.1 AsmA family protein [Paenalcaligenes niemegkensis]
MKVWFKRGLFSLVGLFIVALVGAAIFLLTFDPNAYKNKLEEIVYERYQRKLTINGDIELSLFPRIGLAVDSVALSDRFSDDPFASIESARFAVAIWPLMSNRFVVDHVALRGFKAWIVREGDGSFNFTDLLQRSAEQGAPVIANRASQFSPIKSAQAADAALIQADEAKPSAGASLKAVVMPDARDTDFQIDIAGLDFKEGEIHFYDKTNDTIARVVNLEVNTGRMTFGQPFDVAFKGSLQGDYPIADAQLEGQALVKLDPYNDSYSAQRLSAQLVGDLADYTATAMQLRGNIEYEPAASLVRARSLELTTQGELKGANPISDVQFSVTTPSLNYGRSSDTLDFQKLVIRGSGNMSDTALDVALDVPRLVLTPDLAEAEPIVGSAKLSDQNVMGISLNITGVNGSISDLRAENFSLEGVVKRPSQAWQLKVSSPLHWNRDSHQLQWDNIAGKLSLEDEGLSQSRADADVEGDTTWHLRQREWDGDLKLKSGEGEVVVSGIYDYLKRPTLTLDLLAKHVDASAWIPSVEVRALRRQAAAAESEDSNESPEFVGPVAGPVFDFSPLAMLDINGKAKFENVRMGGFRLDDMNAGLVLDAGDLRVKLQSPAFYQGQMNGELRLSQNNTLRAAVNGYGIEIGELLQDSFGQMRASGKSDIALRLTTGGHTPAAWLSGLNGSFNLDATNGSVYGLNVEQGLRNILNVAKNAFGPQLPPLGLEFDPQQLTDFAALSLQSAITNGQLEFSTLVATTPRLRISTAKPAYIDLVNRQLDLTLQLRLQKAREVTRDLTIAELVGVTVPIQVTGPLAHPHHRVEWESVNTPSVKQALENGLLDKLANQSSGTDELLGPEDPAAEAAQNISISDRSLGETIRDLLGIVAPER